MGTAYGATEVSGDVVTISPDAVRYVGLMCELGGLAVAALGVAGRSRFVGRPGIRGKLAGVGAWLARLGRPERIDATASPGTVAASAHMGLTGTAVVSGVVDPEERLRLLEESVTRIEVAQRALESRLVSEHKAIRGEITEERRAREAGERATHATLKRLVGDDLTLETWGVAALALGLLLTTLSDEISRWLW